MRTRPGQTAGSPFPAGTLGELAARHGEEPGISSAGGGLSRPPPASFVQLPNFIAATCFIERSTEAGSLSS